MSTDLTENIYRFREAARNLWNLYLRDSGDWDSVDNFRKICLVLYREIVLKESSESGNEIGVDEPAIAHPCYRVSSSGGSRLPMDVNRSIPASGYWDYPIAWIAPDEDLIIRPLCFFDFDSLGWRDLEYIRVLIEKCPAHPELDGREALIKCTYAKFEFEENA